MSCIAIYDFLSGTKIVLPRASADQGRKRAAWDILRPNERASALVAEHLQVLAEHAAPEAD